MIVEKKTFAESVKGFDGDVCVALPGADDVYVKVCKADLTAVAEEHGDLWKLCRAGSCAIVVVADDEPLTGCLA